MRRESSNLHWYMLLISRLGSHNDFTVCAETQKYVLRNIETQEVDENVEKVQSAKAEESVDRIGGISYN